MSLYKTDQNTGQTLFRAWGLPAWPDYETDYYRWRDCGIFALPERGSYVEIHMAMRPADRWRCREAVKDVLHMIGPRTVCAPVLVTSGHVCNLARKFGFRYEATVRMAFLDGTEGDVIMMFRRVNNGWDRQCHQ